MTQRPIARITGLGAAAPSRVVTNDELAKTLDTNDDWIVTRTGIRERRVAEPGELLNTFAERAARQALAEAGLTPLDIGAIVVATVSPDYHMPSQAVYLQAALGASSAAAFDLRAACAGFVYGLTVAESLIATGMAKHVLVVGAEMLSTITDWSDRGTAILFGDGAGAVVLSPANGDGRGILSTFIKSDGRLADLLYIPGGGNAERLTPELLSHNRQFMHMKGREVFKAAVTAMADAADAALERAGLTGADVELMVPHQANVRIIEATAKHASIPMEKVIVNVDRYGNTSSASIPLALDEARSAGRLVPGTVTLLVGFGSGFAWGSMVIRW